MPTVSEEDSFSLEWEMNMWGVKFVNGLKMMSQEVWGGIVDRGLSEESEGKHRPDGLREFLNYHSVIK
jgi:hypothetical protein